mmetsp:Transcript_26022/g.88915  ORF Transcript_26022/g.88915 Transcript_26022/m.88915 type:complete len:225 (+) Transcript_26022:284-958(+)
MTSPTAISRTQTRRQMSRFVASLCSSNKWFRAKNSTSAWMSPSVRAVLGLWRSTWRHCSARSMSRTDGVATGDGRPWFRASARWRASSWRWCQSFHLRMKSRSMRMSAAVGVSTTVEWDRAKAVVDSRYSPPKVSPGPMMAMQDAELEMPHSGTATSRLRFGSATRDPRRWRAPSMVLRRTMTGWRPLPLFSDARAAAAELGSSATAELVAMTWKMPTWPEMMR